MKEKNNRPVRVLEPALLTVRDLEQLLQINKRSVARLTKKGILPLPLKLGGSNRWKAADITATIDRLEHRAGRKIEPVAVNQL